jgi:hypothetical protein
LSSRKENKKRLATSSTADEIRNTAQTLTELPIRVQNFNPSYRKKDIRKAYMATPQAPMYL